MINSRVWVATAGRGQPARVLEYVGVILLAAVLVIGIAIAGWGDQLRAMTTQVTCAVAPQHDCYPRPPGP